MWQEPNGHLWEEVHSSDPAQTKLVRMFDGKQVIKKEITRELVKQDWLYLGEITQGYYTARDFLLEILALMIALIVFAIVKELYPDFLSIGVFQQ